MHDASILAAPADAEGVTYRPLDAAHVAEVAALEACVMGSDAWNEALVADELTRLDRVWWMAVGVPAACLPTELAGAAGSDVPRLLGYAGGWVVDGDLQILKVGVAPEGASAWSGARACPAWRPMRATWVRHVLARSARRQPRRARRSTRPSASRRIGMRPRYYSDREDAVIMEGPLPLAVRDVAGVALQVAAARTDAVSDRRIGANRRESHFV